MAFQTNICFSHNLDRKQALCLGAGILTGTYLAWRLSKWNQHRRYHKECTKLRRARDKKIDTLQDNLKSYRLDERSVKNITDLPLVDLVNKIKSGELTAVDVLHAYQYRALEAHRVTNCLTNVIEDAEAWAKQLDARESKEGLLYGVPVSIKDNLPTKGHVNTRGCVVFKDDIPTEDALAVKALRAQGAVPYVKTNIPQLMMGVESSNAIYGTTCNPLDITRTPGGSSGGESALIAFGGSVLGMGSDIGGSIRIPSNNCGLCGIKPSSERISKKGTTPFGQTIVRSCWGPMARDVDSLVLAMQSLLGSTMFQHDKTIPPMPFNIETYRDKTPLTIGYYIDDGVKPATPAAVRAVMLAKEHLARRGHKMVQWSPPNLSFAYDAFSKSISGDRGCLFRGFLGTEELHESITRPMSVAFLSDFFRFLLVKYLRWRGEEGLANGVQAARGVDSVASLFTWTTQVKLYVQEFGDAWCQSGLDAVICPAFAHPALKLSSSATNGVPVTYTAVYNLLDYAAGVVPVTRVTRKDVEELQGFPKDTSFSRYLQKDLQDSEGLPVCVQCVAPMWREEICLKLMKEVEQAVLQ